jgi:nicotinate phosphoribosyltransferase
MQPLQGALLTDLYQLTMIQAYLESGRTDAAVFEFFVRKLPPRRFTGYGLHRRVATYRSNQRAA